MKAALQSGADGAKETVFEYLSKRIEDIKEIPSEFICPEKKWIMEDPVIDQTTGLNTVILERQ